MAISQQRTATADAKIESRTIEAQRGYDDMTSEEFTRMAITVYDEAEAAAKRWKELRDQIVSRAEGEEELIADGRRINVSFGQKVEWDAMILRELPNAARAIAIKETIDTPALSSMLERWKTESSRRSAQAEDLIKRFRNIKPDIRVGVLKANKAKDK